MSEQTYPRYVNVYEVTQAYGGCEEGGWWYFIREPLESIRVSSEAQEEEQEARLRAEYELDEDNNYLYKNQYDHPKFDRDRNRSVTSASGNGFQYVVYIEDKFAEHYPKETPHYE